MKKVEATEIGSDLQRISEKLSLIHAECMDLGFEFVAGVCDGEFSFASVATKTDSEYLLDTIRSQIKESRLPTLICRSEDDELKDPAERRMSEGLCPNGCGPMNGGPGQWDCPKCNFTLHEYRLNAL